MTVVRKPKGGPPLFGCKAVVLVGAFVRDGMRRWQERLRTQKFDCAYGDETKIHCQDGDLTRHF
jgi:hypothetical protein